ncbi:MAG: LytTR family DNA-binding domain-containing protein [Desulfobacteraceae bacterium]|jgi:two-component system LytT family response regulator/two-component system response regulator LytT
MDIKCLIVDDEPPAVDELRFILSKISCVDVVGSVNSASKAIDTIRSKKPDLVFLDIKMPGRDGFEVIHACGSFRKTPLFIFATAYDEHAVRAFEASAVDYILKPFRAERVQESVERARHLMISQRQGALCGQLEKLVERIRPSAKNISKISVEHKGRILLLDPESIVYCKAENKGILACTDSQCYSIHGTASLDDMESKLKGRGFFRSHRGYLVNLACVKEVVSWFNGKYILTANDHTSTEVPVSRRRVKELKNRLGL